MTKKLKRQDQFFRWRGEGGSDPFFPDQHIGITKHRERLYGSPRKLILEAAHDLDLKQYICEKPSWTPETFDSVASIDRLSDRHEIYP